MVVGNKENLEIKEIKLRDINVLAKKEFDGIINIKVRSTEKLLKAKINFLDNFAKVEILIKKREFLRPSMCFLFKR